MSDNVQAELEEELPPVQIKQWVSIPGGSIALRSGAGVLSNFGTELRTAVGRPHRCAFLVSNQADEDLAELLCRDLTTIGFLVTRVDVEDGKAATTVATEAQVLSALAEMHLTADDLVVATGLSRLCQLFCNYIGNSRGEVICSIPNAAKLRLVIRHSRCNHTYLGNLSVVIAKIHNLKICKTETCARLSGNKALVLSVSIKCTRSNRRDNNCS